MTRGEERAGLWGPSRDDDKTVLRAGPHSADYPAPTLPSSQHPHLLLRTPFPTVLNLLGSQSAWFSLPLQLGTDRCCNRPHKPSPLESRTKTLHVAAFH